MRLPDPDREARQQLRRDIKLLELQKTKRSLELNNKLLESFALPGSWWGSSEYGDLYSRVRTQQTDGTQFMPPANRGDRRHGRKWPLWATEQELLILLSTSRAIADRNAYAQGLVENKINYEAGKGFSYKVISKGLVDADPGVPGSQDPEGVKKLIRRTQDWLDLQLKRNRWNVAVSPDAQVVSESRERETMRRTFVDGNVMLRFFPATGGGVNVRFVEPEQIRNPPGKTHADGWSFGSQHQMTPHEDVEQRLAYCVWAMDPGTTKEPYEIVDAKDIIHIRIPGTPSTVKMGTPGFCYDRAEALEIASKIDRNEGTSAAINAAIAQVWKYATGTASDISALVTNNAFRQQSNPVTGNTESLEYTPPGTILRIPEGQEAVSGSESNGTSQHMEALASAIRRAAASVCLPEFMVGADSSNGNYSSLETASGPVVRGGEANQEFWKAAFGAVARRFVEAGVRCGKLLREALTLLDIQVEAPAVLHRNESEQATIHKTYLEAKIMSPQTVQMSLGLDSEVEAANWQEWDEAHPAEGQQAADPNAPAQPDPEEQAGAVAGNDLRTTVGGLQAIAGLQTSYYKGEVPQEAAVANVRLLFGFSPEEAAQLFPAIAPEKLAPDEGPPGSPGMPGAGPDGAPEVGGGDQPAPAEGGLVMGRDSLGRRRMIKPPVPESVAESKGDDHDLGDPDERAALIADILAHTHGDDALAAFDDGAVAVADDVHEALSVLSRHPRYAALLEAWDKLKHPRGAGGRFIPKGGPEAVASAKERIKSALAGEKSPTSARELADHLSILTVKQLHELKKEYSIAAGGATADALREKIAARLDTGRRGDAAKPAGDEPSYADWAKGEREKNAAKGVEPAAEPAPPASGEAPGDKGGSSGAVARTKAEYIAAEFQRLKAEHPDDYDEVLQAQAEMNADDNWKEPVAADKFDVGQTVKAGEVVGSYRGQFTHTDGKKYAVIANQNGQTSVPVEDVEHGGFDVGGEDAREPHQKTWEDRRKELLQGYMSGGRTKATPAELKAMKKAHHDEVATARAKGKVIPPEVLADYPDLAPKPAPAPAGQDLPPAAAPATKSEPGGASTPPGPAQPPAVKEPEAMSTQTTTAPPVRQAAPTLPANVHSGAHELLAGADIKPGRTLYADMLGGVGLKAADLDAHPTLFKKTKGGDYEVTAAGAAALTGQAQAAPEPTPAAAPKQTTGDPAAPLGDAIRKGYEHGVRFADNKGSGLVPMHQLHGFLKRDRPGMTTAEFHAEVKRMWAAGELEGHVLNEVGQLTDEQRDKGFVQNGKHIGYVRLRPAKASKPAAPLDALRTLKDQASQLKAGDSHAHVEQGVRDAVQGLSEPDLRALAKTLGVVRKTAGKADAISAITRHVLIDKHAKDSIQY